MIPAFKVASAVATMAILGAPSPGENLPVTGPGTPHYAGPPPARFIREAIVPVIFVMPSRIAELCPGTPPPGMITLACARTTKDGVKVVIMPHPAVAMTTDAYALLLAHELGHVAGWDRTHPL